MNAPASSALQSEGLRERNVVSPAKDEAYASDSSLDDDEVEVTKGANKEKKTFGRTPDGTG